MNGLSCSAESSTEMPMTCRPLDPYLFWYSTNQGISILQGSHHVAQKSIRITLPLNDDSVTLRFCASFMVKSRLAGLASAGHATTGSAAEAAGDSGAARLA